MKLLHYTYRKLSLLLLLLMAAWGVLFYYAIIDEVMDETDDTLENYSEILINNALMDPSVLETEGTLMSFYKFRPISEEEAEDYDEKYYDSISKAKMRMNRCGYLKQFSACRTDSIMNWS